MLSLINHIPQGGRTTVNRDKNDSKLVKLYSLILFTTLGLSLDQPLAWSQELVSKKIDLTKYGTVASIDKSDSRQEIAISFNNCNLVFLDYDFQQESELPLTHCKRLFRVRYGQINKKQVLVSSIYTGKSVLYDFKELFPIPLHKAAVTDSLVVNDYLLSSSDDGSVQMSELSKTLASSVNSMGLYQSNGVARNLAVTTIPNSEINKVAISYDTGEITVFDINQNTLETPKKTMTFRGIDSRINTFKFSQDGSQLLIGYFTGELVALDVNTGKSQILYKVDSWLNSLDVNGENIVLTGDDRGFVRLISLATGEVIKEQKISDVGITAVAFIDKNTMIGADAQGMVYHLSLTEK